MIDKKMIEHIAKLAKLEINAAEVEEFSEQLPKIFSYFEHISNVNTDNIEPLVTPIELNAYWREDEIKKEVSVEEIVANAPDRSGNLFKVPPVV